MPVFQFGSQVIQYQLTYKARRKTVSIAVSQAGVTVTAPQDAEQSKIDEILYRKATWIRTQLLHFEEMTANGFKRKFVSGEKLPYLGRQYRLKVFQSIKHNQVEFKFFQGQFHANVPEGTSEDRYRELITPMYIDWVKQKGLLLAEERLKKYTAVLQHQPKEIKIREQELRWGSCTPAGNILLNWRIFLAPTSIVDYVLVHELAHLKHMNHSQAYWETVHMLLPDYDQKKEWLRIHGATLFI